VENACAHTGRPGVIAFHGRTLLGMALTGKVVTYKSDIRIAAFIEPVQGKGSFPLSVVPGLAAVGCGLLRSPGPE